jgi:hypothetical protein
VNTNTRKLTLIILAGLLVIALLAIVYPSVSSARPGVETHSSNYTSPVITDAETAAILGAQQLLLQSNQVHQVYAPLTTK